MALRSVEQLLKDGWELYRNNWVLFLKIVLVVQGIYLFLGLLLQPSHSQATLSGMGPIPVVQMTTFSLKMLIWVLIGIVLQSLSNLAVLVASVRLQKGEEADWKEAYQEAFSIFGPYMITLFMVMFLVTLGFIFFLIPGLLLIFFLIFVPFIVVLDKKYHLEAIKESFRVVKSSWQTLAGRIIVIFLVMFVINFVIHLIPVILKLQSLTTLANIAGQVIAPWATLCLLFVFMDMKEEMTSAESNQSD